MASETKVPFDDAPAIVGACLLPTIVALFKLWKNRFGRLYMIASAFGLPTSIALVILPETVRWSILGVLGIMAFGAPLAVLIVTPLFGLAFIAAPIGLLFGAIILFGYETYIFLRTGTWDLHTLLGYEPLYEWVIDRRDWVGLKDVAYYVLNYTPLWLLMLIAAILIGGSAATDIPQMYADARRDYLELRERRRGAN